VWARSDEEKAELFAEYFAKVYTPYDGPNDNEKERQLPENCSIIPEIKYLTVKEVRKQISCLNATKAPDTHNVKRNVKKRSGTPHIYI
jgi:hypothetical protein